MPFAELSRLVGIGWCICTIGLSFVAGFCGVKLGARCICTSKIASDCRVIHPQHPSGGTLRADGGEALDAGIPHLTPLGHAAAVDADVGEGGNGVRALDTDVSAPVILPRQHPLRLSLVDLIDHAHFGHSGLRKTG